ncbi:MAG: hypothetical protein M3Y58_22790 [Chloroflexota bacterium]|nr:hypothetical protein [Chloroflexota bacterium]
MDDALSVPRTDPTARLAVERVARAEREPRLWVSIGECVGEQLVEAYLRLGLAYYGERAQR